MLTVHRHGAVGAAAHPWLRIVEHAPVVSGGDVTPPNLTSPAAVATSSSSGRGTVSTDEANGTLYWVVTQSATTPSVAQIQAGENHLGAAADALGNQAVGATGTQTVNGGGLAASTAYFFHFQHQDAATNDSTAVSSTSFTTSAPSSDDPYLRLRDATNRGRWGGMAS